MPRAGTRIGRVKKLARAGMWVAVGAEVTLVSVSSGWTLVALACSAALGALSVIAAVAGLPAGRRWRGSRGKGGGLSGRGRDDDGPAGQALHRWPALVMAAG